MKLAIADANDTDPRFGRIHSDGQPDQRDEGHRRPVVLRQRTVHSQRHGGHVHRHHSWDHRRLVLGHGQLGRRDRRRPERSAASDAELQRRGRPHVHDRRILQPHGNHRRNRRPLQHRDRDRLANISGRRGRRRFKGQPSLAIKTPPVVQGPAGASFETGGPDGLRLPYFQYGLDSRYRRQPDQASSMTSDAAAVGGRRLGPAVPRHPSPSGPQRAVSLASGGHQQRRERVRPESRSTRPTPSPARAACSARRSMPRSSRRGLLQAPGASPGQGATGRKVSPPRAQASAFCRLPSRGRSPAGTDRRPEGLAAVITASQKKAKRRWDLRRRLFSSPRTHGGLQGADHDVAPGG